MKRILSITTTGLFLTGLALAPMSARADQTVVGGKTVTPTQSDSTATKPMPGAQTTTGQAATDPVKKDDKKASVTPGGSAPASGSTSTKPAGHNPS